MGDLTRIQNSTPVQICDDSTQVAALSTNPGGGEVGLIVRNIPYGIQVAGGTYNASAPTLTNTQQATAQLDSSGNLKVNVVAGGTGGGNVSLVATSVTQPVSGTVTLSSQTVTLGASPTVTIANNPSVTIASSSITQPVSGTVTLSSQTVTLGASPTVTIANPSVTIASSSITQPVSGTVTLSSQTVTLAQVVGSAAAGTAAGNSALIGSIYNTTAPTLTNGQQVSAQCDASGYLCVNVVAGGTGGGNVSLVATSVTQPVSGTVTLSSQTVTLGASPTVTIANNPTVTLGSSSITQPVSGTVTAAAAATQVAAATITANSTSTLATNCGAYHSAGFNISGSWTGTIQNQIDLGGALFISPVFDAVNNIWLNNVTANGSYESVDLGGVGKFCLAFLSDGTGTATYAANFTQGESANRQYEAQPGSAAPISCLLCGGMDASNNLQALQMDASKNLKVALAANPSVTVASTSVTQPVSGTVTTNLGLSLPSALTTGRNAAVGTAAVQLTSSSLVAGQCIQVIADDRNTDKVYIGPSGVTADTNNATDGFPLIPGASIAIFVNNANLLYGISPSGTQKVFFMVN